MHLLNSVLASCPCRSAKSRKARSSAKSKGKRFMRKRPALLPLDAHNGAYLALREEVGVGR